MSDYKVPIIFILTYIANVALSIFSVVAGLDVGVYGGLAIFIILLNVFGDTGRARKQGEGKE
jgi:hypothetical protein